MDLEVVYGSWKYPRRLDEKETEKPVSAFVFTTVQA
jgi:hypothetical protein